MGRRRSSGRRRRGSSGFLYKLLSTLAISAAIIVAMTLFFRVDHVIVTGQQRYTSEEIVAATGVEMGDNLYLMDKNSIVAGMLEQLPYIENIRISRKLPDTLLVDVRECGRPMALVQNGSAWLISPRGKIVEQTSLQAAAAYGILDGCDLLDPVVGEKITLATEYASQQSSLLSLLEVLETAGELERVDAIHLEDLSMLTVDYIGRFTIQMPYEADYARKFRALRQILDESGAIQDNMTGTFDMRREDGKVNLIQNVR